MKFDISNLDVYMYPIIMSFVFSFQREILLPKVPQWHCLRYFKHDILMMRRCRHVRVPMAPRKSNVKK